MGDDSRGTSRIALTGATGFIGFQLQRRLAAEGFPVCALVRPRSSNRDRVAEGVEVSEVALDDGPGLTAALHGVDAVIYAAGAVRGRDYRDFAAANVDGLRTVCEAISDRSPAARLLLISSLAATRPELSHYARSKREGERVLKAFEGIEWAILRPPAVYGPGDSEMLPLFRSMRAGLALIVGPPHQRLSLLHVDDLVSAVISWLRCPEPCAGRIFEIDDGRKGGYGWPDIIASSRGRRPILKVVVPRRILAILGHLNLLSARCLRRAPMLTPGKVRELSQESWLCDNEPFTSITGWTPKVQLEEGVHRLFAA